MELPFVSRAVHGRVLEELRKSEQERGELLGRMMEMFGIDAPVDDAPKRADGLPVRYARRSPEEESGTEEVGAVNIPKVIAMAEAAARRKAMI